MPLFIFYEFCTQIKKFNALPLILLFVHLAGMSYKCYKLIKNRPEKLVREILTNKKYIYEPFHMLGGISSFVLDLQHLPWQGGGVRSTLFLFEFLDFYLELNVLPIQMMQL